MPLAKSGSNLLRVGGGGVLSIAEADSGDFPDLQALYGLPWEPLWPEPPDTSSSSTVSSASQFNSAKAVSGRHITMAAGSYGELELSGTDLRVTVQSGVTIDGLWISNCDHVILEFETPRDPTSSIQWISSGSSFGTPVNHMLFNGIRTFDDGPTNSTAITFHGHRIALINSHLLAAAYGLFADQGSQGRPSNGIIYNNIVDSGNYAGGTGPQSLHRMTGVERYAVIRNRLIKRNDGQLIRWYTKGDVYFAYNQIEATGGHNNPGSSIDTTGDVGTGVYTDHGTIIKANTWYNNGGGAVNSGAFNAGGPVLFEDNVSYSGVSFPSSGPSGYTFVNNTSNSYQAPPAWDFA